jgi:hypothetical protein
MKPLFRSQWTLASQEIPAIYGTRWFITVFKSISSLGPILSQPNPIYALTVLAATVCSLENGLGAMVSDGISQNYLSGWLSHIPDNKIGEGTFYTARGFCNTPP